MEQLFSSLQRRAEENVEKDDLTALAGSCAEERNGGEEGNARGTREKTRTTEQEEAADNTSRSGGILRHMRERGEGKEGGKEEGKRGVEDDFGKRTH